MPWTLANAPGLTGKNAIVTGATSGLGYQTALALAGLGAKTIIAARNPDKAARTIASIQRQHPTATVRYERLDLASLASVARFAQAILASDPRIDILVNNGAVMAIPTRTLTPDGFEQQVAVNYLAHFALTGRLLAALVGGRIVSVASLAHRRGFLGLQDFQSAASYRPMAAYGRSKLAMLIFALELQRRADRNHWNISSLAAHPGWARTSIIPNGMGTGFGQRIIETGFNLVAQSASDGALPLLFAATAPEAKPGAYYGPANWNETRGAPALSRIVPQAADTADGARLWELSEKLTGVSFAPPP